MDALRAAAAALVTASAAAARGAAPDDQFRRHAHAWIATTVAAIDALADAPVPPDLRAVAGAELAAQLVGGVAMGPGEVAWPHALGLTDAAAALIPHARRDPAARARVVTMADAPTAYGDPTLDTIATQFARFTDAHIVPHAQRWHLADALIPDDVVAAMAALGTFGITLPERFGGAGMGKHALCVVTEELSRGWIAAGSLGTRAEIAGDLILSAGTPEQQARWLPGIASGAILPTAVFTEPDAGSDLSAITTRAVRGRDGGWEITGAKSWITHAARADLMTMLVRTRADVPGHGGLSMLLVPKARTADGFVDRGLSGSAIGVLGYRGMREYALQFDALPAPADAVLGGVEGAGFRQLMATFEGARIQTAARSVGVARRALELACAYARDRRQFGRPIIAFARTADRLATVAAEIAAARALTHAAARAKDAGGRCDVIAGMAKLFAARVAWTAADAAVQIHGGAGYALESEASRLLCDARVLSIFEGTAEVQAEVIARGLLNRAG